MNFLHPQSAHNGRLPRPIANDSDRGAEGDSASGDEASNQFPMAGSPQLAPNAREKVGIARRKVPALSPMDWGRLKSSGTDMRGGVTQLQRYTPSDIAQHNKKDDLWIAFKGKVYCCTLYLPYHPGGVTQLMRGAGKDATELFMKVHPVECILETKQQTTS